jgi:hypothetical protein
VDTRGRTIFVADAHRDAGKRFVERLTIFFIAKPSEIFYDWFMKTSTLSGAGSHDRGTEEGNNKPRYNGEKAGSADTESKRAV